ncbi:peptidase [Bifidobacterium moukalabense]|uniref:peptidase n=1 Tax=Bifidobacterium moukalabense TaxID=1333651 RepID=UPI0010F86706|nr:peptidase [Bifidobacterium moukalabense]
MTNVHESLADWETLPAKELDGHRAIAVTINDTTIDGQLIYRDQQADAAVRVESLTFDGFNGPVIVNINETGNLLVRDTFKAINILKETK